MCSNSAWIIKLGGCVLFVHNRSALSALLRARVTPDFPVKTGQMITAAAAGQGEHAAQHGGT